VRDPTRNEIPESRAREKSEGGEAAAAKIETVNVEIVKKIRI